MCVSNVDSGTASVIYLSQTSVVIEGVLLRTVLLQVLYSICFIVFLISDLRVSESSTDQ